MSFYYILACTTCKVQIDLARSGSGAGDEHLPEFVTKHTSCTKKDKDYYPNLIVCNQDLDAGSEYPSDVELLKEIKNTEQEEKEWQKKEQEARIKAGFDF